MSQIELRPGLADVPVAESAISFIDGKNARLEYRGVAVETLAVAATSLMVALRFDKKPSFPPDLNGRDSLVGG